MYEVSVLVCDAGASLLTLYAHLTRFYAPLTSLYKANLNVTACLGMNVESLTGSAAMQRQSGYRTGSGSDRILHSICNQQFLLGNQTCSRQLSDWIRSLRLPVL